MDKLDLVEQVTDDFGYHFAVYKRQPDEHNSFAYLVLAKMEPFVTSPPDGVLEPGCVWFDYGNDARQTKASLRREMAN